MIRKLMAIGSALVAPVTLFSLLWFSWPVTAVESDVITVCASGCGDYTTISDAVLNANDGDVIQVEPGTYFENVVISKSLTIEGLGAGVIVDGAGLGTVLTVDTGVTVTVAHLTIQNGSFPDGGGISNDGTMIVSYCVIQSNEATDSQGGGGIANFGMMTLQHVTVANNSASFGAGVRNEFILNAEHITVTNNSTFDDGLTDFNTGGGIENSSDFYLTNSLVFSNTAVDSGGGIENTGTMTVFLSTIKQNSTSLDGGGVSNEGDFELISSLVHVNSSKVSGGGIHNRTGGNFFSTNSTISENSALNQGGGVQNKGAGATAVFNSSAIYNNSTGLASQVGGVSSVTGTVTLNNTIVAHLTGSADGSDCSTSNIVSAGSNLDSDGSCGLGAGELSAVGDPYLGPLQDNGGDTWTHALLLFSPAVDAATNPCEATDQRGVARPVGAACDIGPYETAVYRIYLPAVLKN